MEALKVVTPSRTKMNISGMSRGEPMNFGQPWVYASGHQMKDMLTEGYFHSAWDWLRPGDSLRVQQREGHNVDDNKNRLVAFCDLIIVASGKTGIQYYHFGDIHEMPAEDSHDEQIQHRPAKVGTLKWGGPQGKHSHWRVMGHDDEMLAYGIEDKVEAQKMADGEIPLPGE